MGTLLDLASLVMIPSGVKEDKLYSVKPTDGSGDFTFSRNSDIQATRVNSSGLIEKAKVNLFDYSNDFSNWTLASITPTSGQSGYDGSSDAWELDKTNTGGAIINPTSLTGVATCSVYAKAGTLDFLLFYINYNSGTDTQAYFDLSSGSVGTTIEAIDANIEQVGSTDWYRCDVSFNCPSTLADVRIFPALADNNSGGTGTIYIQDAQLNYGLIAQDYVETTTTSVVEGITADLPRLDYSGGASCPSLLLEPSRTNLFEQSEYFGASYWTKTNATITDNATTSPEGVVNASALTENTSTSTHFMISNLVPASASTNYTASFFVKYNGRHFQILGSTGSEGGGYVNFDLINGEVGDSDQITGSIESLGDGWYKCSGTNISTASATEIRLLPYLITSPTSARAESYTGDGISGVYIYGAMLEEGSYPTSYIPTYGSATVRAEDDCSKTGIGSILNDSEGTLFLEMQGISDGGNSRRLTISDGGTGNRVSIEYDETAGSIISFYAGQGTLNATITATGLTQTDNHKVALVYNSSVFKMFIDGVLKGTDTTITDLPVGLDVIEFANGANVLPMEGLIKQTIYFNTALSDDECIALTTL